MYFSKQCTDFLEGITKMSKQIFWGHSNSLVLFALIFFSYLDGAESSSTYSDYSQQSMNNSDQTDVILTSQESLDLFHGYTKKQLENCYKRAPEKVQLLIQRLQNDRFMSKTQFRGSFFIGEPGTNKTLNAFAVAYKVRKKFDCSVIHCPELTAKGRGSTTELLNEKIKQALEPEEGREEFGTLLIFEEGDQLFEHAADPHFDTGTSSRAFNTLFNKTINNKKVYSIITVNNCETFSEPLKERILINGIIFKTLAKDEEKIDAFLQQLDIRDMKRHADCSDEFLQEQFRTLEGWSGRNYEALVNQASFYAQKDQNDLDNIIISKDHIIAALTDIQELKKVTKNGIEVETDLKQRERHFKETLRANLISMWIHRKQIMKGIHGSFNVGKDFGGGSFGGSVSETNVCYITRENLQFIWSKSCPSEKPLEFPEENISSDENGRQKLSTTEYFARLALAGIGSGVTGALFGITMGDKDGGFIGSISFLSCGISAFRNTYTTDKCSIM